MDKVKLNQKLIVSFVVFIILPIISVSLAGFGYYSRILQDKVSKSAQQVLTQTANNILNIIDSSVVASNIFSLDQKTAENIYNAAWADTEWERYESAMSIHKQIKEIQNAALHNYNARITVIDNNGNFYSDSEVKNDEELYSRLRSSKWYNETVRLNGFVNWTKMDSSFNESEEPGSISLLRLIKGNRSVGSYGVIIITIPEDSLLNVIKQDHPEQASTVLLDDEYRVISIHGKNEIADLKKVIESGTDNQAVYGSGRDRIIVNYRRVSISNWTIVSLIPYRNVMYEVNNLRKITYLSYGVILILFIILTIYISSHITDPIQKLEKSMASLQSGDFTTRSDIGGCVEMVNLRDSFNTMVYKIENLVKLVEEETKNKQKAHLEALQAQINPHFLINTLNSIKWMANISGSTNVSNMLSDLGNILEGSIYKTDEMITLKEEIDYLDSYVALQKMRFGDHFSFGCRLQDQILDCSVPKFILQPIVENAIIHGISDINEGVIDVYGYSDGKDAVIEIKDNGVGMNEEQLSGILSEDSPGRTGKWSGIGVKNVHERLQLVFGPDYGLKISSRQGSGTTVRVVIPYTRHVPREP